MNRHLYLALLAALIFTGSARADLVTALDVKADFYPDNHYAIGLDLSANHLITRIYFQDETGEKQFYSLDELKEYTTLFRIMGASVVQLKIDKMDTADSATIELQVLQNYLTKKRKSIFFQVSFNSENNRYQIVDSRSGLIIHEAKVQTRYIGGIPMGIKSVETE